MVTSIQIEGRSSVERIFRKYAVVLLLRHESRSAQYTIPPASYSLRSCMVEPTPLEDSEEEWSRAPIANINIDDRAPG